MVRLANALLPGLIAAVSLIAASNAQGLPKGTRPEFPDRDGCVPGARTSMDCPVRMECFHDNNYANGGRCDCNPLWFKIRGKLTFNDSEWDDGFTSSDCKNWFAASALGAAFYWIMAILRARHLYTNAYVIRELIRVKALKRNATAYSLFLLLYSSIAAFFVDLIYALNMVGADPTEYWYMSRTVLYIYAGTPTNIFVDFEIAVTWIDLYDRTNKMSKTKSKNLKILRHTLHFIGVSEIVAVILFMKMDGHLALMLGAMIPPFSGLMIVPIAGRLILKTLCPDKNDTSNPNWRTATSIRRAVKFAIVAKLMEVFGLLALSQTSRDPVLGYIYNWCYAVFWFGIGWRYWIWLEYLIDVNKKYMQSLPLGFSKQT